MKIAFHGGLCCGIKTIYGFDLRPHNEVHQKAAYKQKNNDRYGRNVRSDYNFYYKSRPRETFEERFDAYLDFLKKVRPSGLVEITLTSYQLVQLGWKSVVEKRGFKEVSKFYNSNSSNTVSVYHLIYKEGA